MLGINFNQSPLEACPAQSLGQQWAIPLLGCLTLCGLYEGFSTYTQGPYELLPWVRSSSTSICFRHTQEVLLFLAH